MKEYSEMLSFCTDEQLDDIEKLELRFGDTDTDALLRYSAVRGEKLCRLKDKVIEFNDGCKGTQPRCYLTFYIPQN